MSTAIPLHVFSEAGSLLDDINTTKRSGIPKSLTAGSRKNSPANRKQFIPFVQERDHLGRLIKNTTDESAVLKSVPSMPRLQLDSMNLGMHSRKTSIEKLPNIYNHNSKSLYRMVEDGIKTDYVNDTTLTANSRGMNYSNFYTSLYRIGQGQDNTLEVQASPKVRSLELNAKSQSDILKTDHTVQVREIEELNSQKIQSEKLPPISVYHFPDSRVLLGSITAKSADTLVSYEIKDSSSSINPDSSLLNPTAWRYEASQVAKNQDIESLLKKENKALSLGKLIKVTPNVQMPPIGAYDPALNLVVKRQKNCVILPEQLEKLRAIKRKEAQREKLEMERLKASTISNSVREDDSSDEYYKKLFKGMLNEANDRQKKTKKHDLNKKIGAKKLDYIVLENFKQFPTDFESQINAMKLKLRNMKEKLAGNKDFKNHE